MSGAGLQKLTEFSEIRRKPTESGCSEFKTRRITVDCFKISEKIKIRKIYVKNLDPILRLLVKIFFIKSSHLSW
jgi:hypothetical protein